MHEENKLHEICSVAAKWNVRVSFLIYVGYMKNNYEHGLN